MNARCTILHLLFVALTLHREAFAQDSRTEVARSELIARAEHARAANNHAEALDLASHAAQLRQTPSLRLLLAQEHLALNHLLDALAEGQACVREANADPSLRNRDRLIGICRALTEGLEPRLGHLTVRVPSPLPEGAQVRVGDEILNVALMGVPVPVIPGDVLVRASATNRASSEQRVSVRAGEQREVTITLAEGSQTTPPLTEATLSEPLRPRAAAVGQSGTRLGPWIVAGVGAAALITSGILFLQSGAASEVRDRHCPVPETCRPEDYRAAQPFDDQYRSLRVAGVVTLAIGSVGVLTGLIWGLAVRGQRHEAVPMTSVSVWPSSGGLVVSIGGRL